MIFAILSILTIVYISSTKAYFGAGCPSPFVARTYGNCQAMFGAVKGYYCGQIPSPSDAYGNCVTLAARYDHRLSASKVIVFTVL